MRSVILASIGIFGWTASVVAAEPIYSRAHKACMAASDSVTMKMRDCLVEETKRFSGRLDRAYAALSGKLGAKQKSNLAAAQRAWLRYRQLSCRYYAAETGGSVDIISANTCRLELTARRTLELEGLLKKHIEIYGK